jgi:integrase
MGQPVTLINLKYLHRTKNRHGKFYYAFRKKGCKRIRLPNPGHPAFVAAYQAALSITAEVRKIQPGSMAALIKAFFASTKFAGLDKKSTQKTYRRVLEGFIEEHGEKPVALLEGHHVERIIASKVDTPAAANQLLKRLKQVLDFAVRNDWIKTNPARNVEKIRYTQRPIHTWTENQAQQFTNRHPPGTMAYLAFAIMSCTGIRRSDLITLGGGNIDDDRLVIHSIEKNEEYLNIPIHPLLAAEISKLGSRPIYMLTEFGKPFASAASFGNWFRDRCDEAGLQDCSAHGLRKLIATRLAESGASENTIAAILAWRDNRQAAHYTKMANKKKLADLGMKKLEDSRDELFAKSVHPPSKVYAYFSKPLKTKTKILEKGFLALPAGIEPAFAT